MKESYIVKNKTMSKTPIEKFINITKTKNFEYEFSKKVKKLGSRIVVITAPPGAGKTSCINGVLLMNFFINKIFEKFGFSHPKLIYAPGTTTRPIREGEKHDFDFHFLTTKQFFRQLKNRDFILYFTSDPYLYAVDGKDIERRLLTSDEFTVFIYNLNAFQVPKLIQKFGGRPKVIFLNAPTTDELEKRKFKRGGLSPAEAEFRRKTMLAEIAQGKKVSDIQIINEYFPETIAKILNYIIKNIIAPNAKIPLSRVNKMDKEIKKEIKKNKNKLLAIIK